MKVAILQDWLLVNGGAEKVLRAICQLYPKADIFALIDQLNDSDRQDIIQGRSVKTSFLNRIPGIARFYRKLLPFYPLAVRQLDLSGYDLIITSSYSVIKNINKNPGQLHICYCHSPMRYAYDLRIAYVKTLPVPIRPLANFILKRIAKWDRKNSKGVDVFIANSKYVQERINRIYDRKAEVIYPPVNTRRWASDKFEKEDYYVTASRLVAYKNVHVLIDAFAARPDRKLIVLGDGPMREQWERNAPANVVFMGHVSRNRQIEIIQKAKGLVVAADEDFGITPVEAQVAFVPVIALRKGGYLETVIEGKTGVFYNRLSLDEINRAIDHLDEISPLNPENFIKNVNRFDIDRFKREFLTLVSEKYVS